MAVYLLNDEPSISGFGRYSYAISKVLDQSHTISLVKDKRKRTLQYPGVVMYGIFPPFTTGWEINCRYQNTVFRKVRRMISRDDVIHYGNPHITPIRENDEDIVTFYDFYYEQYSQNRRFVEQILSNLKSYLNHKHALVISQRTAEAAVKNGFKGSVAVVYPPVSDIIDHRDMSKEMVSAGRKKFGLPAEKNLILSVSSGAVNKNLGLMQALSQDINENHKGYAFVKVGAPIAGAINLPLLDDNQLNELYNLVDVYVQPSLDEGFCLPLMEAMKTGLPVVASDIPIFKEVGRGVPILRDIDVDNFIDGIEAALADRSNLSIRGIEAAKEYTFEKFKDSMGKFYAGLGI